MNAIIDYIVANDAKKPGYEHAPNGGIRQKGDENGNEGDRPSCKPSGDTNFAQRIDCTWVNVHSLTPRTDPGMLTDYDVDDECAIGTKRSHTGEDSDDPDTPGPSKSRRSSKKHQYARDGDTKGRTDRSEKCRPDLVLVDLAPSESRQVGCSWRH